MAIVRAHCVTCKKLVSVVEMDVNTGCIQMLLSCGHERRLYIKDRRI